MNKSERAIKYLASRGADLCWHKWGEDNNWNTCQNCNWTFPTYNPLPANPDLSRNTADLRRVIELVPGEWERFKWQVFAYFHRLAWVGDWKADWSWLTIEDAIDMIQDIFSDPALFLEAFDAYITDCEKEEG